ncbi:MAG TPA: FAD:protein FMN transferase [Dehalococcoidia bacterium]|nr:FAD:protein FMN transferase [Dehalococcoidia bacterium]
MKGKLSRRDFIRITAIGAGILAVGGITLKELLVEPELKAYTETRALLGTFITIKVIDTDEGRAEDMVRSTFTEINRLSGILSRFDPTSQLYRLNKTGQIMNASGELVEVMVKSVQYAELTSGAFDVTVLPMLELNSESFQKHNTPPSTGDIAEVKSLVDYRMINISGKDITLAKTGAGITLDSIAKGYIVDMAAGLLKDRGNDNVMVEAGGDMSLSGTSQDGDPWKIGVANPRNNGYCQIINSGGGAIATSGDYEAAFTSDYRYHHIIDPRVGLSPVDLSSTTVLAGNTTSADALATACMVMGKDEALALIENLPDTEALIIDKNLNSYRTSGFPTE